MMTVSPYITLPEVVPQAEINRWREKNYTFWRQATCPPEVRSFIEAMASKLGDFAPYQRQKTMMTGRDLMLCGKKELDPWALYPVEVPVMQLVDWYGNMMRIYKKRGKQGLIDFCKAKCIGTELERVLEILHVHVFHEERPEFKQVLNDINQAQKIQTA